MNIGIMSMQRILNYGSFLQAYALKNILQDLGNEVQFADYHPGPCIVDTHEKSGVNRKISKGIEAMNSGASFKSKLDYLSYKKNFERNFFQYLGINSEYNYSPKLDTLIIGSDEVFNCTQSNPQVGYSLELFGKDNKADRLISYAGSFGNTSIEKLRELGVADEIKFYLEQFDKLSVRDKNSKKIIEELTGKSPYVHLDPVLIFDFVNHPRVKEVEIDEKDYLILYGYSGRFSNKECKAIRRFADKYSLKVYCIGGLQDVCDKFINCNPFEVIAYFDKARYIVTDTFHGTILSIITKSKFVTIPRAEGYGNQEKIIDLVNRIDMNECLLHNISELEDKINRKIDYNNTCNIIKNERLRSNEYLKENI